MDRFKLQINPRELPVLDEWQSLRWICPSNIALIKYWGKHGNQLPDNPSLSFTLKKSITRLNFQYKSKENKAQFLEFLFENKPQPEFKNRILRFLETVKDYFPFLDHYRIRVNTLNTFPHSSGIASSASAMGALALALCEMERELCGTLSEDDAFYMKASFIARLASGSASRSVFGGFVSWGQSSILPGSSDLYAQPLSTFIHEKYRSLRDAVLIVSSEKKKVSSSFGHQLMSDHVYHQARIEQAHMNLKRILASLKDGDFNSFSNITEQEALGLHALMMSSHPGFLLIEPETWVLVERIRELREQKGIEMCFTLDAGPNIHLIYPEVVRERVLDVVKTHLLGLCENRRWIDDQLGDGPSRL